MDNPAKFFAQQLNNRGIDATVNYENSSGVHYFYINKNIGGKKLSYVVTITETELMRVDASFEERIATISKDATRKLQNKMSHTIDNKTIGARLHTYKPKIECLYCDKSFELDQTRSTFTSIGELSVPTEMPISMDTMRDRFTDHQNIVVDLYLIGKLKKQCDSSCPNSYHNF